MLNLIYLIIQNGQYPIIQAPIRYKLQQTFKLFLKIIMYDSAITVFSPNGHLFQVQYAIEAVKKGLCSVGLVTDNSVILAVEKKTITKLQEGRTVKKIVQLDKNIFMAYSGLTADGRILANKARIEAQSFRLNYDDNPSVDYISKFIAQTKQKYTQRGGVRPFGISSLIAGIDNKGNPRLFYTDPSGLFSEWKAQSCGRNSKQVCEYLQKHYKPKISTEEGMKLIIKALLDVVESGNKNIELMVINQKESRVLTDEEIEKLIESTRQ